MPPPEAAQNSYQAQPSIWFCCWGDRQVGGLSWPPDVRPLGWSLPSPAAAERNEARLGAPGTQHRAPSLYRAALSLEKADLGQPSASGDVGGVRADEETFL